MLLRSFKKKILLLSVLTSGLGLFICVVFFMSAIRRIGLERIDRELHTLGDAQLGGPKPHVHWPIFDRSLATTFCEGQPDSFLLKVSDPAGQSIYTSTNWPADFSVAVLGVQDLPGSAPEPEFERPPFGLGYPPPMPQLHVRQLRLQTLTHGGHTWRFLVMANEQVRLVLGRDLAAFEIEVQRFRYMFFVLVPIVLLLLAGGGWFLAGQALRPVQILTRVAGNITAQGLHQRVPLTETDYEFQSLIDVINGMLDRLERSFQQATRFSADAAHELKTPLAILQGRLAQALQEAPRDSKEQRTYAELLEETQRLKGITRKLLLLAQADSGQLKLALTPINVVNEIETLIEDTKLLAPHLILTKELGQEVHVRADLDLLRQVLHNLASNAIKYNRSDGRIDFRLGREAGHIVFTLGNSISPDGHVDPLKLFERFYRGDIAHSRKIDGTGLGLSLAREIARAHQGDLVLQELQDDYIAFKLTLPGS